MTSSELFSVEGYGVVVTGGASGLGLAFAEALAENGAAVTILDVDGKAIESEVARLVGAGHDVRGEVVDVTDHARLDAAFDAAVAAHGRLDVAFANAGIDSGPGFVSGWAGAERPRNDDGALESYTDERWNRVIDVNLNGVFATIRSATRHLRPQRSGRIIVTTSLAAIKTEPVIGAAYMAAKAGCAHLTRNVALELAAYGITVERDRAGLLRHQHRRWSRQGPRRPASDGEGHPDAPGRVPRRHQGPGTVPRLARVRLRDGSADRHRRRVGPGARRLMQSPDPTRQVVRP